MPPPFSELSKFSPCNLAARCRASGVADPTGSREILVLGEGRVAASPSEMFSIVAAGPGAGNLIFQTLQKVAPQPYSTFFQHPPSAVGGSGRTPTANPAPFGRATRRPTHCDRRYGIPDPLDPEISGLPRPDMGWGLLPFFKGPRDPKRRSELQNKIGKSRPGPSHIDGSALPYRRGGRLLVKCRRPLCKISRVSRRIRFPPRPPTREREKRPKRQGPDTFPDHPKPPLFGGRKTKILFFFVFGICGPSQPHPIEKPHYGQTAVTKL